MEAAAIATAPVVRQWALAYAELGAKHVLSSFGHKAKGRLGRRRRKPGQQHPYSTVEPYNRHTVLDNIPSNEQLERMLAESFEAIPPEAECMRSAIYEYAIERIVSKAPHDVEELVRVVTSRGCDPREAA